MRGVVRSPGEVFGEGSGAGPGEGPGEGFWLRCHLGYRGLVWRLRQPISLKIKTYGL